MTISREEHLKAMATMQRKLLKSQQQNKEWRRKFKQCQRRYKLEVEHAVHRQKQSQTFAYLLLKQHEEEKIYISRELHDEVGQLLASINFEMTNLNNMIKNNGSKVQDRILHSQGLIEHTVNVIQNFSRELSPIVLDDLGLTTGIKSYVKEFTRQTNIKVNFNARPLEHRITDLQKILLFRITQEALANILKHSKATNVDVKLKYVRNNLQMDIQDNGVSFDVKKTMKTQGIGQLGLLGMRERVSIANGKLNIMSRPSVGTRISVEIPLGQQAL